MTRQEFLDQLRRALGSRVGSDVVNENVSYYEEYIAAQVRAGRAEEDVLDELGDPRLLARSIEEAKRRGGYTMAEGVSEEYEEETKPLYKNYRLPGWMILAIVILAVLLVLGIVFSILRVLLPIIIPVALVMFLLRTLSRK